MNRNLKSKCNFIFRKYTHKNCNIYSFTKKWSNYNFGLRKQKIFFPLNMFVRLATLPSPLYYTLTVCPVCPDSLNIYYAITLHRMGRNYQSFIFWSKWSLPEFCKTTNLDWDQDQTLSWFLISSNTNSKTYLGVSF